MMQRQRYAVLIALILLASMSFNYEARADIKPVAGLTLFGGAERGTDSDAGGIGGVEIFGVLPFSQNWGLQGSLGYTGRSDTNRVGLSLGPVFGYSNGKLGLFVDYEFKNSDVAHIGAGVPPGIQDLGGRNNHFIFIRGVWSHYFSAFDLTLSYSQPTHKIQNSTALRLPPCTPKEDLTLNELKGVLSFYPTNSTQINAGMLVNSFAGPDRNATGTGVGGVFGASWQISGPFIWNIVQGQMDSRSRYRVTSGLQFAWTPASSKAADKPLRETTSLARLDSSAVGSGVSAGA